MDGYTYLIDTCVFVDCFRGNEQIQQRLSDLGQRNFCTASVCMAELYTGAFKSRNESELNQVKWLDSKVVSLPFDRSYITYAKLRSALEKQGSRIADIDLIIASIAIDNNLTLVTGNARHFSRIPGLKLLVWTVVEGA